MLRLVMLAPFAPCATYVPYAPYAPYARRTRARFNAKRRKPPCLAKVSGWCARALLTPRRSSVCPIASDQPKPKPKPLCANVTETAARS